MISRSRRYVLLAPVLALKTFEQHSVTATKADVGKLADHKRLELILEYTTRAVCKSRPKVSRLSKPLKKRKLPVINLVNRNAITQRNNRYTLILLKTASTFTIVMQITLIVSSVSVCFVCSVNKKNVLIQFKNLEGQSLAYITCSFQGM